MVAFTSIIFVTFATFCGFTCGFEKPKNYKGFRLVQVRNVQLTDLEHVQKIADDHYDEIDIWSYPSKSLPHMDVAVGPKAWRFFVRILHNMKKPFRTLVTDLQRLIKSEAGENAYQHVGARYRGRRGADGMEEDIFRVDQYHTYDEILAWMKNLQSSNAKIAKTFNVAMTFEKRPLRGMMIGSGSPSKPAIWIDAGIHAREWIAPATAVYIINFLVQQYNVDADITRMVDQFNWYILPVANPDGYAHTIAKDRLWRKTRSRHNITNSRGISDCVGVDANRNWAFHWGELGAVTGAVCSGIYAGPHAFSEPETYGMKSFLEKIQNLKVYISFHSYGQLWLSPWGYKMDKPENFQEQKTMAQKAIEMLSKIHNTVYQFGSISDLMYPASGTSIDYIAHKNVPYVFGLELRPEDKDGTYGFLYPPHFIVGTGRETVEALRSIASHLYQNNHTQTLR